MSWPDEISSRREDCFDVAAMWHARWRDSKKFLAPSPEEISRWADWIQVEENKRAYDAIVQSSQLRHQLASPALLDPPGIAANNLESDCGTGREGRPLRPHWSVQRLRESHFLSAAAGLLICFIGLYLYSLSGSPIGPLRMIATAEGEREQVLLEDGSRVWLGNSSQISIQFTSRSRTIHLHRGEALFDVARNPSRPFMVVAGNGTITAIGTKFSVRRTLDRVTVRVAEGAVKVDPKDAAPGASSGDIAAPKAHWTEARLASGDEVTYGSNQRRSPVESADPRAAAAWLEGRREYRHEPLAYVVADISRCFGKHIEVSDADIGELQFTGRVYEAQVEEWLRALETIFPVEVVQTNTDHLIIRRRNSSADAKTSDAAR